MQIETPTRLVFLEVSPAFLPMHEPTMVITGQLDPASMDLWEIDVSM